MLPSHADADEAAQVAFVRAWGALERFRGESSLRTWLVRIVLNVAKTMRAANRPTEELPDAERVIDPMEASDQRLVRAQARQVVTLKVFSEMTYREVADVMELSEGAVKAHMHQAASNLRRLMAISDTGRAER